MKRKIPGQLPKPLHVHAVCDAHGSMQPEPTVSLLIAAVKAQQTQIHELTSRISALEGLHHAH